MDAGVLVAGVVSALVQRPHSEGCPGWSHQPGGAMSALISLLLSLFVLPLRNLLP